MVIADIFYEDSAQSASIPRTYMARRTTMATIMLMHWPEASEQQYQDVRREVNWEGDVPAGAKFHVAWFAADGFHVLDVWESREAFESFAQSRLMPGVQKVGVQGQPSIQFETATAIFAPNPA
ncbi:MAG TPA: hypothetical protein VN181_16780 [Thermoanaerobaculia bacterium]|nr:hypothetical protein [Thermoanaerobaculia bacterium]